MPELSWADERNVCTGGSTKNYTQWSQLGSGECWNIVLLEVRLHIGEGSHQLSRHMTLPTQIKKQTF